MRIVTRCKISMNLRKCLRYIRLRIEIYYSRRSKVMSITSSEIPGNELQDGLLKNVATTLCYREPDPPSTTGIHRYMFLVYEQQNPSVNLKSVPDDRRGNWSLADYVSSQETKLCGPVAGTQFRTRA
ncbi:phosphatidylethanolamine-binding protein homolog F40A3.3-like isoform X1 [Cephus cinctus]|uniref:Phosphatidylethanolamine-binding protein homolog F40A3.3-like isoform X1 n=1 Tax=Cephus cinctus TaxID=211228 RepID=A0AAJ7W3T8_CEPCN|nr:phosphatidylethanolamine-binding protein homolog F40A3.3-like isoform X1 [Cephus cinctus]